MRSFKRAAVVGAMALPLAFGGAGFAAAESPEGHQAHDKCAYKSCGSSHGHGHGHGHGYGLWFWKWADYDAKLDTSIVNAGIIG
ncbi:hypothetical protein [Actinopolyspora mortivallis]|nr:hypothetical protein [Actinopolyspora mortivallis]